MHFVISSFPLKLPEILPSIQPRKTFPGPEIEQSDALLGIFMLGGMGLDTQRNRCYSSFHRSGHRFEANRVIIKE